jgi:hypothetical protein
MVNTKKEKRSKKERKQACGNCRSRGNRKGGLRRLLLDDFHRCLEKAYAKDAPAFSTVTTGPATINT